MPPLPLPPPVPYFRRSYSCTPIYFLRPGGRVTLYDDILLINHRNEKVRELKIAIKKLQIPFFTVNWVAIPTLYSY